MKVIDQLRRLDRLITTFSGSLSIEEITYNRVFARLLEAFQKEVRRGIRTFES